MELTKEQLAKLNRYLKSCGIKYYDVRSEIVDHFATKLEEKLDKNQTLNFKNEIIKIHKEFGGNGFKDFLEQKKLSVKKKFYKLTFKHLRTFFKVPKIIISIGLFFGFVYLMNLYENPKEFFSNINVFFIFLVVQFGIRTKLSLSEDKFLILNRSEYMFWFVYSFYFLILDPIKYFRNNASYENTIHNYIQIIVVVILILTYWCLEHVYYQNKKEIKNHYPNVIV
ncbi:hypothetical protein [uncultured Polaribacter sp.]|uniref:hypothetical protein n=1 Tax=uncultured Polaribacter sp. TaxID=174711 RepID=UPI002626AEE7|nr:hypothetical protein [uncultured Polaribacter sp.]